MDDQAIMVEKCYGRPIMPSFHAFFSIGGLTGAGVATIVLDLNGSPMQQAIGIAVFVFIFAAILFPWLLKQVSPATSSKQQ